MAERKATPSQNEGTMTPAEVEAVYKRATTGDAGAMAKLQKALDRLPQFWGDMRLATQIEEGYLKLIAGDNLVLREGVRRELGSLKEGLAGPSCSPLEHLLVERIAACWLQVQWADYRAENISKEDLTLAQADYRQRRQDRAHRRLLSAVRTLALVRKLALPVLQVNIGEKQVNIAQAGGTVIPPAEGTRPTGSQGESRHPGPRSELLGREGEEEDEADRQGR